MTQPLALVFYEKLLPGTQLVNRLQDLRYRVQTVGNASLLVESARQAKPIVVFMHLHSSRNEDVCAAMLNLRQHPDTQHLPIIAFAPEEATDLHRAGQQAGATLVVSEAALLTHLTQFLDQALHIE